MSSILTNNGAMVALQALKSINSNLGKTQEIISTGKAVGSAKDNSAVWAISKVMESDVQGFKAIRSSLSLGESTVSVARQASETVTDLLTQMKDKIVASQESNVDRDKIQLDIDALRGQIESVVGAAQFNGLNLLNNADTAENTGSVDILSSLDRSGAGVAASNISVGKQDLGTGAATGGTTATTVGGNAAVAAAASGAAATFTGTPEAGGTYEFSSGGGLGLTADVTYVAREGDTLASVSEEMVTRLNFQAASDGIDVTFAQGTTAGEITFTNNTDAAITVATAEAAQSAAGITDGAIGGGLEYLSKISVGSDEGAEAALGLVEGLIQTSIDAAASFGSVQGRIETQSDFVSKITDALKSGIGTLVDANMEEASARLQALQVQQQLGVQSLSIANQAPQSILSLFR